MVQIMAIAVGVDATDVVLLVVNTIERDTIPRKRQQGQQGQQVRLDTD